MKTLVSTIVAAAAFCAASAPAAAQDSAPVAAAAVFNAPVSVSSEGFVRVRSFEGDTQFRGPVMQAASEVVQSLASQLKLRIPRDEAGLVIYIRDGGATNDARVIENVVRTAEGRVATWVTLPSPAYCSLRHFRRACAAAFFRAWTDRNRRGSGGQLPELPSWAVEGIIRAYGKTWQVRDAAAVMKLWRSGEMPFLPRLFPAMRVMESERGAALAGFFALWMRETPADSIFVKRGGDKEPPQRIDVFRLQLERLACGEEWNADRILADLSGSENKAEQDAALDERIARNARAWLLPGEGCPWDAEIFASSLSLCAPFGRPPFADGSRTCSFRRAVRLAERDMETRLAAAASIPRIRAAGEGRDPGLRAAAEAYAAFLEALARGGKSQNELDALLDAAEERLAELHERLRIDWDSGDSGAAGG